MPQLRAFPETDFLLNTDAIWIDRVGVGTQWAPASAIGGNSGQLITSNGLALNPGFFWLKSSLGAFTGHLPSVAHISPGESVVIGDIDYNAGVNNYTVNAHSGDMILDHGTLVATYSVNISNAITLFVANSSVAPYDTADSWTVVVYGA